MLFFYSRHIVPYYILSNKNWEELYKCTKIQLYQNPNTLLVEIKNVTAILENSLEVPQKS